MYIYIAMINLHCTVLCLDEFFNANKFDASMIVVLSSLLVAVCISLFGLLLIVCNAAYDFPIDPCRRVSMPVTFICRY